MAIIPPPHRHRKSIRLTGYNYDLPGAYFVTICTQDRECLFGEIVVDDINVGEGSKPSLLRADQESGAGLEPASTGQMVLNEYGRIVQNTWDDLVNHIPCIALDHFVIMPNHVHGIIFIRETDVDGKNTTSLSEIVRQFKTFSARRINMLRNTPGVPLWQRNYYEHIVRDDEELKRIRQYIELNPAMWAEDENNPVKP